jgi:hypothetical protein
MAGQSAFTGTGRPGQPDDHDITLLLDVGS